MKVFALSDIHIDYENNKRWLFNLSMMDYRRDVLILAGDITDNLQTLEQCFIHLSKAFKQVLYVPGNHELWVVRDSVKSSLDKFKKVSQLALDCDITMQPCQFGSLSIVPLLGWYDFSFGEPVGDIQHSWIDFRHCIWPDGYQEKEITHYFLSQNSAALEEVNDTIISFSHFLPLIEVMPSYIPEKHRNVYPVLGSQLLGEQVKRLNPLIHVYGHSHINQNIMIDGVQYINNAFGYPAEKWFKKELLCIYEC